MIATDVPIAQVAPAAATRLLLSYEGDGRTPILDAARAVLEHWKFITLVVLACVAAGVAGLILISPKYRVQAQYLFAADASMPAGGVASRLGGLAALAGVNLGGSGTTHAEVIAKLRSRKFIEQFIIQNSLITILFANRRDETGKSWREGMEPSNGDGFQKWSHSIAEVSEDKASGLLRIEIEWTDPELAAAWCAQMVAQLNQEMRADAIARADASLRYLEEELARTSSLELRGGLYALIEATTRDRMMAEVSRDYALRPVDPPVAPEEDEEIWPAAIPFVLGGAFAGLFLSIAALAMLQAARVIFGRRLVA